MKITPKQLADAWYELLQQTDRSRWDDVSQKFLLLIQREGRVRALPHIQECMIERDHAEHHRVPVTINMAHELPQETVAAIVQRIFGDRSLDMKTHLRPELLGGLTIETKNSRWDLSLRSQLHQLVKTINA